MKYNRSGCNVLVVCKTGDRSNHVRSCLKSLGFSQISACPSLVDAIDRFRLRHFTHVLFECEDADMPLEDFVEQVLEMDEKVTVICVSKEPRVDDVFGLLRSGARHFLVVPFTVDTLESVLIASSEGPPLSEAVLYAADRNGALAAVVLNNLYRVSVVMRQAREFPSAAKELDVYVRRMVHSMDMAVMFCDGEEDDLLEAIVECCISRANIAATRLGRTRKKLRQKRIAEDVESENEDGASVA